MTAVAMSAFEALEAEHEALLAFLYLCPAGIVQFAANGAVRMINPYAAQLLMPLSPTRSIVNFFEAIESRAPELRNITNNFAHGRGQICHGHRIFVSGSGPGPRFLSCSLLKISADCLVAVLLDISSEVQQEQQLKQNDALFAALVTGVNDFALFSLDANGWINTWNRSGVRQTGFSAEDMLGRDLEALFSDSILRSGHVAEQVLAAAREGWSLREAQCVRHDGQRYWCQILVAAVESEGGTIDGYSVVMRDVTERRMTGEELRRLLTTDHLTGATNRAHFFDRATAELARSRRNGQTLSVIMLDVDHFKRVNDDFGHSIGDALLQALVRHCRTCLAEVDILARLGGEEFVVLLPNADLSKAALVAEQMRQIVATELATLDALPVKATVSLGCAEMTNRLDSIDGLLQCADEALYQAKRAGRDQVVLASSLKISSVVAA